MRKTTEVLTVSRLPTPIGTMVIVTDEAARLRALDWDDYADRLQRLLGRHYGTTIRQEPGDAPPSVADPLKSYFAGRLAAIDAIPVKTGGTAFQRAVWRALRRIPAGQTTSYGALAAAIGRPRAVRAVGLANGANPIGLVVPCHRVIGADGSLTGYAGGLDRKRWLLAHEAK